MLLSERSESITKSAETVSQPKIHKRQTRNKQKRTMAKTANKRVLTTGQRRKFFSEMTVAEFRSSYVEAVSQEKSYVGGDGHIEDALWCKVEAHQRWALSGHIALPDYDSIAQLHDDWV